MSNQAPHHIPPSDSQPSIFTNCSVFKSIAVEAYENMRAALAAGPRPRGDGGYVISYDPFQKSFKAAFEVIVFTGVWFEPATHLNFVQRFGLMDVKQFDRKFYEQKLTSLGCADQTLIDKASRLRKSRNHVIHEKAYLNSHELKFAQGEAENAYSLLMAISDESGRLVLSHP